MHLHWDMMCCNLTILRKRLSDRKQKLMQKVPLCGTRNTYNVGVLNDPFDTVSLERLAFCVLYPRQY